MQSNLGYFFGFVKHKSRPKTQSLVKAKAICQSHLFTSNINLYSPFTKNTEHYKCLKYLNYFYSW